MKKCSRRLFLGSAGAVVVGTSSLFAPLVKRANASGAGELVVSGWGGSYQDVQRKVYFEPFAKEFGIEVKEVNYQMQGLAQVKAQAAAGNVEVDLLDGPPFWKSIGKQSGLTQEIDLSDIEDAGKHIPSALDPWGYSYGTVSMGLGYNKESFPNGAPAGWADFWNVDEFPGARGMFAPIAARHLEYALIAKGVAPSDVNPIDAAKEEAAFKALEQIRNSINIWYTTFSQVESMLLQRELDLSEYVHGRAFEIERNGGPLRFEFNGAVMNLMTWVMAKGAPNSENARKFIGFCSRADRQAAFANALIYGPTNSAALDLISDDFVQSSLPTNPVNLEKQVILDVDYWAKNLGVHAPRWAEITSG
jgi:putative spermidine/putrescine transport system substrate-binding protein